MRRHIQFIIASLYTVAVVQSTFALELLATPGGQVATVGQTVQVDILHRRNNHVWIGGFFSVEYDAGLELIDFAYTDTTDPLFNARPQKSPGVLANSQVGSFSGLDDDIVIQRLWFRVLREGTHTVSPSAVITVNAEWASAIDFGTFVVPTYRPALITTPSTDVRALVTFDQLPVARVPAQLGSVLRASLPIVSTGVSDLNISDFQFDDNGRDEFRIANEDCTQVPLASGAGCEARVEFTNRDPLGGARRSANLVINSDASSEPTRKVRVNVDVSVRDIRISRNEFNDLPAGEGHTYSVFLRNAGDAISTFELLEFEPQSGEATFSIVRDACTGTTLGPAEECELDLYIDATPDFSGTVTSRLLFRRDIPGFLESITLVASPPAKSSPSRHGALR